MNSFIPVSQPSITATEIEYVTDAVTSTWISSIGPYISRFEEQFAAFCGTKHAVSVSNGTTAIQLALAAHGIGRGDEVIVPDLSFIATANAVLHAGAKPVFVDIDPFNLCLDPTLIEAAITERTKAILPVHLYGHPADMHAINRVAQRYDLIVIEDAAEAHGAECRGARVGSLGRCGTFSFYGNKNLTTGEGGMITTNDYELDQHLRQLRDHAMSSEKRYWHTEPGFNFRLTNIQAALGCAQLERADEFMQKRRQLFQWYQKHLGSAPNLSLNRTSDWAANCYWLVCVEIDGFTENQRDHLMQQLKRDGIDSRPYFYPMSDMPYFETAATPVSHSVYRRGISIPTFCDMNEAMVERVCRSLLRNVQRIRNEFPTQSSPLKAAA